jgi:hypothetical protein
MTKSKARLFLGTVALLAVSIIANIAIANTSSEQPVSKVNSIALRATGGANVSWSVDGNSSQGFKVVWSKNENPVYPNREGDRYHYYAESNKTSDTLEAFAGDGRYFVRVCEYLGGKCGVYSNQVTVAIGADSDEQVACTLEYNPVCGEKQVQCIKAPCPPIKTTYGNKCQLNAAKAKFLYAGECKKDVVKEPNESNAALQAKIKQLEAKLKKVEAENRRLFKLIKLREREIMILKSE